MPTVTLRATQTQLTVYERNVAAREDATQITRWREQAGEGTTFETQQAASTLEQARATIPQLKQTIEHDQDPAGAALGTHTRFIGMPC